MLSIHHDARDNGAGLTTASENSTPDCNPTVKRVVPERQHGVPPRRAERLLVQHLCRLCARFTLLRAEKTASMLCQIVVPVLRAIMERTSSSANRKDVASAVALLASRTQPGPLHILTESGLPQLIFDEAVSIHFFGRCQKTIRPYVDRELFQQLLLTLCALAAQESVKIFFLKLRSKVHGVVPTSPLVFFCQICLATGTTRDHYLESLATIGIGCLLTAAHRLASRSGDGEFLSVVDTI